MDSYCLKCSNFLDIELIQERLAKIEEEQRHEEVRKQQELEDKKTKIEQAEALARRRREEDVDDSKIVSFGIFKLYPQAQSSNLVQYLYIIRCLIFKYQQIFLQVLKVFDESLGELNKKRRLKIPASISKEGT